MLPHEHKFEKQLTTNEWWSPIHQKLMRRVTGHHYQCVICSRRAYSEAQARRLRESSAGMRRAALLLYLIIATVTTILLILLWLVFR